MAKGERRRGDHEGSIYKRDGGFRASVQLGGKRFEARRRSYAGALKFIREKVSEFEKGTLRTEKTPTLAQFLDGWLERVEKTGKGKSRQPRSPKTVAGYRSKVRLYVTPTLGPLALDKVTPAHLERLYDWMAAGSAPGPHKPVRLGKGQGLSPQTIGATHIIVRAALGEAVERFMLPWNPASVAKPPAVPDSAAYVPKIATPQEWRAAIDSAPKTALGALVVVAASTGLRRGEVMALRWDQDVHLDAQFPWISVNGSLQHVTGEGHVRLPPKNKSSARDIAIPEFTATWLRTIRRDAGYVVANADGSSVEPSSAYRRSWVPLREKLGYGNMRLHDLRHSLVTHQHVGPDMMPVAIQAYYFGHELQVTTFKTYTTITTEDTRQMAKAIDAIYSASK